MSFNEFAVRPLKTFADARGMLFEPLTEEEIRMQRNVHVVTFEPGTVRGNHYHVRGAEIAVMNGPMLVRIKRAGKIEDYQVPEGQAWKFYLPAGLPHASKNTGTRATLSIGFNSEAHDPANPDTVREVLIES
ncbi:MAG: cupin domain-containing protein [Verrucomicrobiota bacterium]